VIPFVTLLSTTAIIDCFFSKKKSERDYLEFLENDHFRNVKQFEGHIILEDHETKELFYYEPESVSVNVTLGENITKPAFITPFGITYEKKHDNFTLYLDPDILKQHAQNMHFLHINREGEPSLIKKKDIEDDYLDKKIELVKAIEVYPALYKSKDISPLIRIRRIRRIGYTIYNLGYDKNSYFFYLRKFDIENNTFDLPKYFSKEDMFYLKNNKALDQNWD